MKWIDRVCIKGSRQVNRSGVVGSRSRRKDDDRNKETNEET